MIPFKDLKTPGMRPWERFVTTYSNDYNPLSERLLQDNQLNFRTEAKPALAFINPPQTKRETWPVFYRYIYKTTNNTYGSFSQPPTSSLHLASSPPFGIVSPVSEVTGVIGCGLREVRKETGPLLVEKGKGHLHCVFGGNANVLEQRKATDESQQKKVDILYEEGVIVLSSHVIPSCCDFLGCVQHLINHPVTPSPFVKEVENWETGMRQAVGQIENSFLQPTCGQCTCYTWKTKDADRCCFEMQTVPPHIPQSSNPPPAPPVQPTLNCSEPSSSRRTPLMTEYQASYNAGWAQPTIQQNDFQHCPYPQHCRFHPSL